MATKTMTSAAIAKKLEDLRGQRDAKLKRHHAVLAEVAQKHAKRDALYRDDAPEQQITDLRAEVSALRDEADGLQGAVRLLEKEIAEREEELRAVQATEAAETERAAFEALHAAHDELGKVMADLATKVEPALEAAKAATKVADQATVHAPGDSSPFTKAARTVKRYSDVLRLAREMLEYRDTGKVRRAVMPSSASRADRAAEVPLSLR